MLVARTFVLGLFTSMIVGSVPVAPLPAHSSVMPANIINEKNLSCTLKLSYEYTFRTGERSKMNHKYKMTY